MCCRVLCEIFWRSKHRAGGFVELDNQEKAAGQSDDQMKLPPIANSLRRNWISGQAAQYLLFACSMLKSRVEGGNINAVYWF